ncbi:hypothetical protein BACFIN_07417 [Bacteroides finegoldii DSM 17565]|nr:hypothetical protein BACFIN_07417 [Bacteroides finegoldii DSM 17565]
MSIIFIAPAIISIVYNFVVITNGLTRSCVQQLTWLVTNYYLEGIR